MSAPYYTGDAVPLKFKISNAMGAIKPSSVKVIILTPTNGLTEEVDATIDPDEPYEISYCVPGSVNVLQGLYKTYFVNTLSCGERTHKIEYKVAINPEVNR